MVCNPEKTGIVTGKGGESGPKGSVSKNLEKKRIRDLPKIDYGKGRGPGEKNSCWGGERVTFHPGEKPSAEK